MIEIVNVVGSGELGVELDVEALAGDVPEGDARYDPENYHGMYLRFDAAGPLLVIYRSGKYIITGAGSEEEVQETRRRFLSVLTQMGVLEQEKDDAAFSMQNYVCQGDLGEQINLNALTIGLGLENTEYEPEQFPGMVYRPEAFDCVLLVFGSGKTIIRSRLT